MTLPPPICAGPVVFAVLLIAAGCPQPSVSPVEPTDPLEAILSETDPVEQTRLLEAHLSEHPGEIKAICTGLPEETAIRRQCERARSRPHLYWPERPQTHQPDDISPHLRMRTFPVPDPGPAPWLDAEPADVTPCLNALEPTRCIERLVGGLADDIPVASRTCLAWDPDQGKSFDECVFRLSEVVAADRTPARLQDALALCPHVQRFGEMCILHTILLVSRPEMAVTDPGLNAEHALQLANAITDTPFGEHYVDLFWSVYTATIIENRDLAYHLFPSLPPDTVPHTRMAIATRTVASLTAADFTPTLLDRAGALTSRSALRPRPGGPAGSEVRIGLTTTWRNDLAGEVQILSITRFGQGLRATDADPNTDACIAVLEAAAMRTPPPPPSFFFDLIGSQQPEVVRWTAARLGRQLYPVYSVPTSDPSELVSQRLQIQ